MPTLSIDDAIAARSERMTNGCLIWRGAMRGGKEPTIVRGGEHTSVRRYLFRARCGWVPANLGFCRVGGERCIAPEHAVTAPHRLPKFALNPGHRRLREYGSLAIPARGPAVSDVHPCPKCGGPMTGFRAVCDELLLVDCEPSCFSCNSRRMKWGGYGNGSAKYSITLSPRRLRFLADRLAVRRFVELQPVITVSEPTIHVPVDLWLFDDRPVLRSPLRERLAARNLAAWRRQAEEALVS